MLMETAKTQPMVRFEGKVALVAGGSGGVGAAAVRRIAAEGGAMTCYNSWRPVTEDRQPRDIMAEIAQAWEMKLIYPAFKLAQQTRDFTITLYQCDGFSVHFMRRRKEWKQRIEQAIYENAHRDDFLTWLEWIPVLNS